MTWFKHFVSIFSFYLQKIYLLQYLFYSTISIDRIIKKFENGIYKLSKVVLNINCNDVYVNKNKLNQDEIELFERMNWLRDKVLTPKLKGFSYDEYNLYSGPHCLSTQDSKTFYITSYQKSYYCYYYL